MQDQPESTTPIPQSEEQPVAAARAEGEQAKSPAEEAGEQEQREQKVEATAQDRAEPTITAETPSTETSTEQAPAAEQAPGQEAPAAETAPKEPPRPRLADLQPGMMLDGTVTRIEKFGAFVNLGLADRRDGLIHISELAPHRVRRVEDVVKAGDKVRVRVVSVDRGRGRIGLSLNEAPEQPVSLDEVNRSNEPVMTSMALAFERARNEKREAARSRAARREDRGERSRREQEEIMRRLAGQQ